MAESEFDKVHGSDAHTRMVTHVGESPRTEPVEDVSRNAMPHEPPVPGAQWDEVHRRWEHWNEDTEEWEVVGGDDDDGVAPADENPLPSLLARELLHEHDLEEATVHLPDAERAAEPTDGPPGAQWNEVEGRWERWDEASDGWVEAT